MDSQYYAQGHTDYRMGDIASQDSRILNVIGTVKAKCPPNGRVLDIGCGDMFLRSQLPGLKYTGVDLDTSKAPEAVKHDLAVTPYPFEDASFDVVICSEVLEHLWSPEKTIAEIRRVLKPGGAAVITVPNFDCIDHALTHHTQLLYNKEVLFTVEHIRLYTPATMGKLLEDAGFEIRNLVGNSAYMSGVLAPAHAALSKVLKANGVNANHASVDQVIGLMLPHLCPGFMIEAQKRDSSSQPGAD